MYGAPSNGRIGYFGLLLDVKQQETALTKSPNQLLVGAFFMGIKCRAAATVALGSQAGTLLVKGQLPQLQTAEYG